MNTPINDGGPAFPMQDPQSIHAYAAGAIVGVTDTEERDRIYTLARAQAVGGMTMLDYFATHAPTPPDDFSWATGETDACERLVRWNWHYADAMLKARQQ